MKTLDACLRPWATGPILIGLGIFCALFMAGLLTFARTFTTETLLDGRIAYDSATAHNFLTSLKPFGQQRYLMMLLGFDLVFPVCYVLWICLLMIWLDPGQQRWWLLSLPICAGLFDWCENFGIAGLVYSLPAPFPLWLQPFTLTSTQFKWGVLGLCTVINGVFIVLRFWKRND